MDTSNRLSWIVALFGLWELLSPFILGYTGVTVAVWDAVILGVVVIVLALWSALSNSTGSERALDWINAIIGLWFIVAPFVLGFSTMAVVLWNSIIVGIVIALLGAWSALSLPSTMGTQETNMR